MNWEQAAETILKDQEFPIEKETFSRRLKGLYQLPFEIAQENGLPISKLEEEMIQVEQEMLMQTACSNLDWQTVFPLALIQEYGQLSWILARNRIRTQTSSLLAQAILPVYEELANGREFFTKLEWETLESLRSETLMDFLFAAGKTDNTSLRFSLFTRAAQAAEKQSNDT